MTSGAEAAAGIAAVKYFGLPVIAGALAAALGFVVLWPTNRQEACARFTVSIASSFLFGPSVYATVAVKYPWLVKAAVELASKGGHPEPGLVIAGPCYVAAALPAWWLLGLLVRALDKYRDKTLIDAIRDVKRGE